MENLDGLEQKANFGSDTNNASVPLHTIHLPKAQNNYFCILCKHNHNIYPYFEFKEISMKDEIYKPKQSLPKLLRNKHISDNGKSAHRCNLCNRKYHTMFHNANHSDINRNGETCKEKKNHHTTQMKFACHPASNNL